MVDLKGWSTTRGAEVLRVGVIEELDCPGGPCGGNWVVELQVREPRLAGGTASGHAGHNTHGGSGSLGGQDTKGW